MFPNFPNLTTPAQNQLVPVAAPRSQTEENAIIAGGRAAPGIVQRRRIPGDCGAAGQASPYPWRNPESPTAGQRAAMMKKRSAAFHSHGVISTLKSFFVHYRPFSLQSPLHNLLRSIRIERFNRLALGKLARVRKIPAN